MLHQAQAPDSEAGEGQLPDGAQHPKTALVFIHGMGVQDRYQQLADFTEGLTHTLPISEGDDRPDQFKVAERVENIPKGDFIPLRVVPPSSEKEHRAVEVDVYEIFWGPLLNGLTTPLSVLQFAILTIQRGLIRALPWNHKSAPADASLLITQAAGGDETAAVASPRDNPARRARRQHTSARKWAYEVVYFCIVALIAALMLQWALGVLLLGMDQLANPSHRIIQGDFALQSGQHRAPVSDFEPNVKTLRDMPVDFFTYWDDQGRRARVGWWQFPRQAFGYTFDRDNTAQPGLSFETQKVLARLSVRDLLIAVPYLLTLYWFLKNALQALLLLFKIPRSYSASRARTHRRSQRQEAGCSELSYTLGWLGWRITAMLLSYATMVLVESLLPLILLLVILPLVVFQLLYKAVKRGLTEVLGDLEVYITRNENSAKYAGRAAVLERCEKELRKILESPHYDAVYICGHSQGSIIGLDVLRRFYTNYALQFIDYRQLDLKPDDPQAERRQKQKDQMRQYEKLKAFITFGCPLEKTRLFLDRIDYRSSFQEFNPKVDERIFFDQAYDKTESPQEPPHSLHWFNFWIWGDIVGDPLPSYPVAEHHQLLLRGHRNLWPHSDYWKDPVFVRSVLRILTWANPLQLNALDLAQVEGLSGKKKSSTAVSGGESLQPAPKP